MEKLWLLLKENISPPQDGKERINYSAFLNIANLLPQKCRHFFAASTFLKFDRDEYGRIDILSFFHCIVRKVNLFQTRIQISLYDSIGYKFVIICNFLYFLFFFIKKWLLKREGFRKLYF